MTTRWSHQGFVRNHTRPGAFSAHLVVVPLGFASLPSIWMPRYFFDLHIGYLSEWDDEGHDAEGANAAVEIAKDRLPAALGRNRRPPGASHAVIMIRDRLGHQVATVTLLGAGEARVVWPPGRAPV